MKLVGVVALALVRIVLSPLECAASAGDRFVVRIESFLIWVVFIPLRMSWVGHARCAGAGVRHCGSCAEI